MGTPTQIGLQAPSGQLGRPWMSRFAPSRKLVDMHVATCAIRAAKSTRYASTQDAERVPSLPRRDSMTSTALYDRATGSRSLATFATSSPEVMSDFSCSPPRRAWPRPMFALSFRLAWREQAKEGGNVVSRPTAEPQLAPIDAGACRRREVPVPMRSCRIAAAMRVSPQSFSRAMRTTRVITV